MFEVISAFVGCLHKQKIENLLHKDRNKKRKVTGVVVVDGGVVSIKTVEARLAFDEICKSVVAEADVISSDVFVALSVITTVCTISSEVTAVDEES